MRSLSVYRGQSRSGIGEGPVHPIAQGEQYLDADAPLANDGALLESLRPWLTLDGSPRDREALGERLEGWSIVDVGDRLFVARLTAAGTYDQRPAYFAHGRAWPVDAVGAAFDPGLHLGDARGFDAPWRERTQRPQPVEEVPGPPTLREPETAAFLLAHLYEARVHRRPVVMAVPLTEFAAGGGLAPLVAFARAALPLALKRTARIRVYTRLADLYLRHLGVQLIVVPEDEATTALAARREATLLDRSARRVDGRTADGGAQDYAVQVVEMYQKFPGALVRFSARSVGLPWGERLPTPAEAAGIRFAYTVAAQQDDPPGLGKFVLRLFEHLDRGETVDVPWRTLLDATDLLASPADDLTNIILAEPRTADARALRSLAEVALRDNGETIGDRLGDAPSLSRVLELHERGLLDEASAGRLLGRADARRLIELVREGEAGGSRFRTLLSLTERGVVTPAWLPAFVDALDDTAVADVCVHLFAGGDRGEPWRAVVDACIRRLAHADHVPTDVGRALAGLPVPSRLTDVLAYAEVLVRSEHPAGHKLVRRLVTEAATPDERRTLVIEAATGTWRSLTGFEVPAAWRADVAREMVQHRKLAPSTIAEALELRAHLPQDAEADVVPAMDEIMRRDARRATSDLVGAQDDPDAWLRWRLQSAVPAEILRESARAWLRSPTWSQQGHDAAPLEQWKRAIRDLHGALTPELLADRQHFPSIPGFEAEQVDDLCTAAADDLAALAALAQCERVHAERVLARLREAAARLAPETRAAQMHDCLQWLATRGADATPRVLDVLEELVGAAVSPTPVTDPVRRAARALLDRRYRSLALALDPALRRGETLVQATFEALRTGDAANIVWNDVARDAATVERLAAEVSKSTGVRGAACWRTFLDAAHGRPQLLAASTAYDSVPALTLGLALMPDEGAGRVALQVASRPAARAHWADSGWWTALVNSISHKRVRSPEHRTATAVLVLERHADAFGPEAARWLRRALSMLRDEDHVAHGSGGAHP